MARRPKPPDRVCGAYARSTGKPCQAPRVPGKRRCRRHGGLSCGPVTEAGRAQSARNLEKARKALNADTPEAREIRRKRAQTAAATRRRNELYRKLGLR